MYIATANLAFRGYSFHHIHPIPQSFIQYILKSILRRYFDYWHLIPITNKNVLNRIIQCCGYIFKLMSCTGIFDNYIFTIQFWTVNLSPFITLTTVLDVHLILHDYIFHGRIFDCEHM